MNFVKEHLKVMVCVNIALIKANLPIDHRKAHKVYLATLLVLTMRTLGETFT